MRRVSRVLASVLLVAAFGLVTGAAEAAGRENLLPADQAFQLQLSRLGPATYQARWRMPDGYYLYREQLGVTLESHDLMAEGRVDLPAGKHKNDEFLGPSEVYYGRLTATIRVPRGTPGDAVLELRYQGCLEKTLCYPPQTRSVPLAEAAAASSGTGGASTTGRLSEQGRLARLIRTGHPAWVMLAFFGFGLLLTFTPCVLPMIPILSGLILGQGPMGTGRAFALSLTYVLAMAATYTAAGVVAGLFGHNLQALFQNPWVIAAFSAVFVALALSMFGFFELQVPAALQERLTRLSNRQRGGTLAGVAVMGLLSALIVGPCVAPPLAGALLVIGQTGDPVAGGTALFALSMGMGAPLLVVGTSAGRLLPRAGSWLNAIRSAFGVLLLAVAVYLLQRIVPGPVGLGLWAAVAVTAAVQVGALDRLQPGSGPWRRLGKGAGLLALAYGVVLLVGAAGGGHDPLQPLRGMRLTGQSTAATGLSFQTVDGPRDLEQRLAAARSSGRPVMLELYADWCVSCKELERYTFSDPGVKRALSGTVLLRADVTENDATDRALLERYGLFGPPSILFFDRRGRELTGFRVVGYVPPDEFRRHVRRAFDDDAAARPGRDDA